MFLSNISFEGKTGIITGGTKGIGLATAKQFAQMGGKTIVIGRGEQSGLDAVAEIGNGAVFYSMDLSNSNNVASNFEKIIEEQGKIDVLINNAGIVNTDDFDKLEKADWDKIIDVDLTAVFLSCQTVFRHMAENGGGRIVNVASIAGKVGGGYLGTAAYASAKAAVISLTKAVAKAGCAKNIYCNSLCPAYTKTPLVEKRLVGEKLDKILAAMPLHRGADPMEVASAILFLASDAASFIQGENLNCDGGLLMDG